MLRNQKCLSSEESFSISISTASTAALVSEPFLAKAPTAFLHLWNMPLRDDSENISNSYASYLAKNPLGMRICF